MSERAGRARACHQPGATATGPEARDLSATVPSQWGRELQRQLDDVGVMFAMRRTVDVLDDLDGLLRVARGDVVDGVVRAVAGRLRELALGVHHQSELLSGRYESVAAPDCEAGQRLAQWVVPVTAPYQLPLFCQPRHASTFHVATRTADWTQELTGSPVQVQPASAARERCRQRP